jgi:predicted small secreted protein
MMNWKSFILGATIGLIGGVTAKEIIKQRTNVSPEKVLESVKRQFKQHGPISGSWIHMEACDHVLHPINYRVYKGGISRNSNGTNEQFEFIADATTGTILEVKAFS